MSSKSFVLVKPNKQEIKTPTQPKTEIAYETDPNPLIGFDKLGTSSSSDNETKVKTSLMIARSLPSMSRKKGEHYKFDLKLAASAAANGSGVFHGAILFDPSSCSNWSSLASLFDEFRVTAVTMKITNAMYFQSTTTNQGYFSINADNDSTAALSTIDQSVQYGNSKQFGLIKGCTYHYKRPDVDKSAYWVDCATPSNSLGCLNIEGTGLLPSVTVIWTTVMYTCEFRSTR